MLLSSGYKLPKTLLVHGYLNIKGKKMSKSLGNVIDPLELLNKYSSDTVRYSLLKCTVFEDSDYSEEILIERNNNELANKLGNLVSRVSTLAETYGLESAKPIENKELIKKVTLHLENLEFDKALNEIFSFIDNLNELIQNKKPWETKDMGVLYQLANGIKDSAILLSPFIPETSEKIAKTFNFAISLKALNTALKISKIKKSDILFKKIDIPSNHDTPNRHKISSDKPNINKSHKIEGIMSTIEFKDWEKIDLRVAKIEKVEDIEGADKLYKLTVSLGKETRVVCAGLKKFYSPKDLKGKKVIIFVNLAPRMMKGIESQGMLLAAVSDDESQVVLISPEKDVNLGSKIR
jgi:methionyl-tRNA synthetase